MGPEGFEPSPCELKARYAAVTPQPRIWSWYPFQSLSFVHDVFYSNASGRKEFSVAEFVRIHFLKGILTNSVTDEGRSFLPLAQVARKGVEPLFPPYQSSVLNRWTTGLCGLQICDLRLMAEPSHDSTSIANHQSQIINRKSAMKKARCRSDTGLWR